ncbi:MAG: efflux RND transporter periplasmic adaptor subunit, partial [Nitrospirales bacterium]
MRRTLFSALAAATVFVMPPAPVAPQEDGQAPAQTVIVAQARMTTFVDRVEVLGTTRGNETVRITANVTEKIVEIRFDDAQTVEAGDVLVVLDKAEEEAQLQAAEALLIQRRVAFKRAQRLAKQRFETQAQLDLRRAELEQAAAEIAAIRSRIANRIIRAPFSGIVGLRHVSVGALVAPGDLITTLDDLSVMKVDFSVPATHLTALQPGLPIVAKSQALGNREFTGEVRSIDSQVDPVTRSVLARAVLPNPDGTL